MKDEHTKRMQEMKERYADEKSKLMQKLTQKTSQD